MKVNLAADRVDLPPTLLLQFNTNGLQVTTLDEGVRALFVDFRKAFDLVDHNILITKLNRFNIPHCLLQSYLTQRCQRVKIDRCLHLEVVKRWNAPGFAAGAFIIHSLDRRSPSSL